MPRPKSYQENVRNFTNAILAAAPDAQLVPKPKPKRKRRRQKPEATEPAHESRPRAGTCKKTCHVKCDGILEVVHTDTMVRPKKMVSRRGNRYTQLFVDEQTHKTWAIHMRTKDEIYSAMDTFEKLAKRQAATCIQAAFRKHIRVKRYRTDGDGMTEPRFGSKSRKYSVGHSLILHRLNDLP